MSHRSPRDTEDQNQITNQVNISDKIALCILQTENVPSIETPREHLQKLAMAIKKSISNSTFPPNGIVEISLTTK